MIGEPKMDKEQRLKLLLEVRKRIRKDCPMIPTPSVSPSDDFKYNEYPREIVHNFGWNNGVWDAFRVVQRMIEEIAEFVSVCCGAEAEAKTEEFKVGKFKSGKVYSICTKCGKKCKQEWRIKSE